MNEFQRSTVLVAVGVLCTVLLVWTITGAVATAGGGQGLDESRMQISGDTETNLHSSDQAGTSHAAEGACVWHNTVTGDAYRSEFDVSCPTSTLDGGTVQINMSGGWAYLVTIELPRGVDSATLSMETPYEPNRPDEIATQRGVEPEEIASKRGEVILRPFETRIPKDGRRIAFRAAQAKAWTSAVDVNWRDVGVVAAGQTIETPVAGENFRLYPAKPLSATFELPPGVYDFEVTAYKPRTVTRDEFLDAVGEQFVQIDGAPTNSGTFSVGVGDCNPRYAAHPKQQELGVREEEASADLTSAANEYEKRQRGGGGGATSRAAQAASGAQTSEDGTSGSPLTRGLPDVTQKQEDLGLDADQKQEDLGLNASQKQEDSLPNASQKRDDSRALNPVEEAKRNLGERVIAGQQFADRSSSASKRLVEVKQEQTKTATEVRRCHGGGYVPVAPRNNSDFYGSDAYVGDRPDGWGQEDEPFDTDIDGQTARKALAEALRDRGFEPPEGSGLTMEDYTWSVVTQGETQSTREETKYGTLERLAGTRQAYVRVGPDGNLLPNPQTLARQRQLGNVEEGTLEGASHMLNVEMHELPDGDGHDTRVRFVEVETGIIQNQREGVGGTGDPGLTNAVKDGFDKLEVNFGAATDGRAPDEVIELSDGDGGGGESGSGNAETGSQSDGGA